MAEDKLRAMDVFRRFDADQDGLLSPFEFGDGVLSAGIDLNIDEVSILFDRLDRAGEGVIKPGDFCKGVRYRHHRRTLSDSGLERAAQLQAAPPMSPHRGCGCLDLPNNASAKTMMVIRGTGLMDSMLSSQASPTRNTSRFGSTGGAPPISSPRNRRDILQDQRVRDALDLSTDMIETSSVGHSDYGHGHSHSHYGNGAGAGPAVPPSINIDATLNGTAQNAAFHAAAAAATGSGGGGAADADAAAFASDGEATENQELAEIVRNQTEAVKSLTTAMVYQQQQQQQQQVGTSVRPPAGPQSRNVGLSPAFPTGSVRNVASSPAFGGQQSRHVGLSPAFPAGSVRNVASSPAFGNASLRHAAGSPAFPGAPMVSAGSNAVAEMMDSGAGQ